MLTVITVRSNGIKTVFFPVLPVSHFETKG